MISPSQRRKHMDVRLSFRLRQNLQYCSLPCLFLPHPSPLQSFNMFFPLNQALQFFAVVPRLRKTPHPQDATLSFLRTILTMREREHSLTRRPLWHGSWVRNHQMSLRQKYCNIEDESPDGGRTTGGGRHGSEAEENTV